MAAEEKDKIEYACLKSLLHLWEMQPDFQVTNICDLKSRSADAIENVSIGTLQLGCEENKYNLRLRLTNFMFV